MPDSTRSLKKILIADAASLLRRQMAMLLRQYGYETMEAASGPEALELLRQHQDVDLLILDVVMPVLEGQAVIAQIRSDEQLSGLPILVLTSTEHISLVAECTRAGCDDFLVKPVAQSELLAPRARRGKPEQEVAQASLGLFGDEAP